MANVGSLTLDVVFNGKKAMSFVNKFNKQIKDIQKTTKQTNRTFSGLVSAIGTGAFMKLSVDGAKFAHNMDLIAKRTGITSTRLMEMRSAFNSIGASGDDFAKSLDRIGRGISRTFVGDDSMQQLLQRMGIYAFDESGKPKSVDTIIREMARWGRTQKAQGTLSENELAEWFMQNFGIPFEVSSKMLSTEKDFDEFMRERVAKTGKINKEQDENLKKLNQSLSELSEAFSVATRILIAELAPVLSKITGWLTDFVRVHPKMATGLGLFGGAALGLSFLKNLANLFGGKAASLVFGKFLLAGLAAVGAYKLGEAIGEVIAEAVIYIKDRWQGILDWMKGLWNDFTNALEEIWDSFKEHVPFLKSKREEAIDRYEEEQRRIFGRSKGTAEEAKQLTKDIKSDPNLDEKSRKRLLEGQWEILDLSKSNGTPIEKSISSNGQKLASIQMSPNITIYTNEALTQETAEQLGYDVYSGMLKAQNGGSLV